MQEQSKTITTMTCSCCFSQPEGPDGIAGPKIKHCLTIDCYAFTPSLVYLSMSKSRSQRSKV